MVKVRGSGFLFAIRWSARARQKSEKKMQRRWLVVLVCTWGVMLGGAFPVWTFAAYPGECHYIRYTCTPMESTDYGVWAHTGFYVSDTGTIHGIGYTQRLASTVQYRYCTVASIYGENSWWDVSSRELLRFHADAVLPGEQYQPGEPEIDYSRTCTPPSNPANTPNPDPGKPDCPQPPL